MLESMSNDRSGPTSASARPQQGYHKCKLQLESCVSSNLYLVAVSRLLRLSREQCAHKRLVRGLQQLLVLCHHKVLVLDQEVVCLVTHTAGIVVNLKACLGQLWLGEALAALDLRRAIQAVGKVYVGCLRKVYGQSAHGACS